MTTLDQEVASPATRPDLLDGGGLLDFLRSHPVIAILRAPDADRFLAASRVLYAAGIRCLEFTLTSRGATDAVREVAASLPADVLIGVGTVRSVEHVDAAVDAGAQFLVSQVFKTELSGAARRRGIVYLPGALTPTEIVAAFDSGAPAVKISPVGPVGGLGYFDQVRAPLPEVPLLPTGGVALHEVSGYLDRGAVAVGLSGPLLGDALLRGGDLDALGRRAEAVVESARR